MEIYIEDQFKSSMGRSSCSNCSRGCRFGEKVSQIDIGNGAGGKGLTLKIMWPNFERQGSNTFIKKETKSKRRLTRRGKSSSIGIQTDAMKRKYKRKNINSKSSIKKAKANKIARIRKPRNKAKIVKPAKVCCNCKCKNSDNRLNVKKNKKERKAVISETNLMDYLNTLYDAEVVGTPAHQAFVERVMRTASGIDNSDVTPSTTDTSSLNITRETPKASKRKGRDLCVVNDTKRRRVLRQSKRNAKGNDSPLVLSWRGMPHPSEFASNASSVTITRRKRRAANCVETSDSQPQRKKVKPNVDNSKNEKQPKKTDKSRSKVDSDRTTLNRKRDQRRVVKKSSAVVSEVGTRNNKAAQAKKNISKEASENDDNLD